MNAATSWWSEGDRIPLLTQASPIALFHISHVRRRRLPVQHSNYIQYNTNSAKMKCFLINDIDSTEMNC
jgi:hypothetical protein